MAGRSKLKRVPGNFGVSWPPSQAAMRWFFLLAIAGLLLFHFTKLRSGIHLEDPSHSAGLVQTYSSCAGRDDLDKPGFEEYLEAGAWRKGRLTEEAASAIARNRELWEQPDPGGWVPCLQPSPAYLANASEVVRAEIYLVAVVTGGLNQMRRQVGAAVVIAHVLKAALVVPVLAVNAIWKDRSEFADLFDVPHFRQTLAGDVRIVTTLPVAHLRLQRAVERQPRLFSTPEWLRDNLYPRLRKDHVMLLRGLDSTLADDLPADLQKLRCKVEFQALQFAQPIRKLGHELARRMWSRGPYVALHLRLERDVWVRTGCLSGLGPDLDAAILRERQQRPEFLTARSNLTAEERLQAGLCPLTAAMVTRILTALGANNQTRIYWAGGDPYGGVELALAPLRASFGEVHTKGTLASPAELASFRRHGNMLAALDFQVALESDVFLPSHGGNMAHVLQGHRVFHGHRRFILPNKRKLVKVLLDPAISRGDLIALVRAAQKESKGPPQLRTARAGRDVVGYPVPECMCQRTKGGSGR